MDKINISLIAAGVVYSLIIFIVAVKQHYKIKTLQDDLLDNQVVIASLQQELSSPEYQKVKKCTSQKVWVKECIKWEFNNGN